MRAMALLLVAGSCATPPSAGTELPVCEENFGPGQVQVKWENELGCDLVPPQQLVIVVDRKSWKAETGSPKGWGGDASLAWATQELEDSGCRVVWHGGRWAEGQDCDY